MEELAEKSGSTSGQHSEMAQCIWSHRELPVSARIGNKIPLQHFLLNHPFIYSVKQTSWGLGFLLGLIFTVSPAPRTMLDTKDAVDKYLFNEKTNGWVNSFNSHQITEEVGKCSGGAGIVQKAEDMVRPVCLLNICGISKRLLASVPCHRSLNLQWLLWAVWNTKGAWALKLYRCGFESWLSRCGRP